MLLISILSLVWWVYLWTKWHRPIARRVFDPKAVQNGLNPIGCPVPTKSIVNIFTYIDPVTRLILSIGRPAHQSSDLVIGLNKLSSLDAVALQSYYDGVRNQPFVAADAYWVVAVEATFNEAFPQSCALITLLEHLTQPTQTLFRSDWRRSFVTSTYARKSQGVQLVQSALHQSWLHMASDVGSPSLARQLCQEALDFQSYTPRTKKEGDSWSGRRDTNSSGDLVQHLCLALHWMSESGCMQTGSNGT